MQIFWNDLTIWKTVLFKILLSVSSRSSSHDVETIFHFGRLVEPKTFFVKKKCKIQVALNDDGIAMMVLR
jgi:hypothetical protein